jgi:uncharacterized membrane protein
MDAEELLLRELQEHPQQKLNKDDVPRVAKIVSEYQGKINAYLHEQQEKKEGRRHRFADWVANFVGSWPFVLGLAVIVGVWVIVNDSRSSLYTLSFCLSIFTVFQAALIQMSQNRQAVKDKQEQMLDNAINYKAEQENLEIQHHLRKMDERLNHLEKQKRTDS